MKNSIFSSVLVGACALANTEGTVVVGGVNPIAVFQIDGEDRRMVLTGTYAYTGEIVRVDIDCADWFEPSLAEAGIDD